MLPIGFIQTNDPVNQMENGLYEFNQEEMSRLATILKAYEAEVQRLQLENRRLEMEKEVLMKLLEKLVIIQKGDE